MTHQTKTQDKLLLLTSGGDSPRNECSDESRGVIYGHFHGLKVYACHNGASGIGRKQNFSIRCTRRYKHRAKRWHNYSLEQICRTFR